jgi:SAM-dependent methyltransferase
MSSAPTPPTRLRRSDHLSWFAHMGAVYLFHDLYGYLMQMSPDIAELIEGFAGGADTVAMIERFRPRFEDADPAQFVDVLAGHAVLNEPDDDELALIWAFVPVKGKWNVWRRRGERLTLWTAWGDRPVTQVMLDPDETAMWDAFDGEKRLGELKTRFDAGKLAALVQRLTHSDVQALKLSMMPMSTYAKRPSLTPAYLTSTMPYAAWRPGTPVPGVQGREISPVDYYAAEVADANGQFDHQETTLSHLFRVAHPALAGRTYGEALADALVARGAVPAAGPIRVLEIGAGLGYVAHDLISRLNDKGREVRYQIVELAPALAAAQRARLGDRATWTLGNVLDITLEGGAYDLIIANEMIGDLPALALSRPDIGLAIDGTGTTDLDRVRALGAGAALAADLGVNLDDATEPFYLMTGAFQLVAKVARWLAPGGTAVLTEFGDRAKWPTLSSHLDHPELSTHFGQLAQAATGAGLKPSIEFVMDILDLDRAARGLATTRSHFRALQAMFADAGVDLAKVGYTPALLDQTVAGKLDLTQVGELRWDKIEDRLMGLVPHEFKALILKAPPA